MIMSGTTDLSEMTQVCLPPNTIDMRAGTQLSCYSYCHQRHVCCLAINNHKKSPRLFQYPTSCACNQIPEYSSSCKPKQEVVCKKCANNNKYFYMNMHLYVMTTGHECFWMNLSIILSIYFPKQKLLSSLFAWDFNNAFQLLLGSLQ